jgi:hypothetical protein
MLSGHHEAGALVKALHCPQLLRLTVHPRASAPTVYQLRSPSGQVLVTTTHQFDVVARISAITDTHQ